MKEKLDFRRQEGSLRLPMSTNELVSCNSSTLDFSSNDYLGLAHDKMQQDLVEESYKRWKKRSISTLGATGSRLLSGDSLFCRELENCLAKIHNRPAAMIFNSGYDANLSVLSSLLLKEDVVLLDELCHNSLIMGIKMSRCREYNTFQHNDMLDLRKQLEQLVCKGKVMIVVESVYSMDGDVAPLREILDIAYNFGFEVVVDEAHGLGSFGRTNVIDLSVDRQPFGQSTEVSNLLGGTGVLAALELEAHPSLLCSIFTYGKAAGCHGAVVCGSTTLRDYLWNYARPFIYSTALPLHSLISIQSSYESMIGPLGQVRRSCTFANVRLFRETLLSALPSRNKVSLWPSPSPIQALVLPGNDNCVKFCRHLYNIYGIRLYPIRAPTVPKGKERVRIILHAHNSEEEVLKLAKVLLLTLWEMGLVESNFTSKL